MNNEIFEELKQSIISTNNDIKSDYPFSNRVDFSIIHNEFFISSLLFIMMMMLSFVVLFVIFELIGVNKVSSSMIEIHMNEEIKEKIQKKQKWKEEKLNDKKVTLSGVFILGTLTSVLLLFSFLTFIMINASGDYHDYTSKKINESNLSLDALTIKYDIFDFKSDEDKQKIYFTKDEKIYGEVYFNGDIKKGKENTISIVDGVSLENLIRDIESEGHIIDENLKKHLLEQKDKIQSVELININL